MTKTSPNIFFPAAQALGVVLTALPFAQVNTADFEGLGVVVTVKTPDGNFYLTQEEAAILVNTFYEYLAIHGLNRNSEDMKQLMDFVGDVERTLLSIEVDPEDIDDEDEDLPRWKANIRWDFQNGMSVSGEYTVDEVEDIHDIVEEGPDWNDLKKIAIELEYQL